VLRRAGHTEAAVDLARLAGLFPAGVICEILNEDGSMARMPQLIEVARKHGLKILTIADLIAYRRQHEKLIRRAAPPVSLPTKYGHFTVYAYESEVDPNPYLALVAGKVDDGESVLVRMHSSCITGDLLGSLRCDCGSQLELALRATRRRLLDWRATGWRLSSMCRWWQRRTRTTFATCARKPKNWDTCCP
jgi:3,4-dihydroxy 2-butanone 4-phosphate synthase/GTP cyclohydrolase II